MFHEYALDPAALSTWERVRFFLDAFGPWKGRFLVEYPRKWRKMVYLALDCSNVDKSRAEVKLSKIDARTFISRSTDTYDGNRAWLDNAEVEHAVAPFRAIIATETRGKGHILDAATVGDEEPLWATPPGGMLARDPRVFAAAIQVLLRISSRIVVIDPYFRAKDAWKRAPLTEFCRAVAGLTPTIEVHFATECNERTLDPVERAREHERHLKWCLDEADRLLPAALPSGTTVTLRGWKERPGGQRLHNRYLITNIGGVQFGDGVERGAAGQEDRVSILDEASRVALWDHFVTSPGAFDAVGADRQVVGRVPLRGA